MYARLRDGNVSVRKNAVMVLTHLILNDMIKIKGQVKQLHEHQKEGNSQVSP